MDSYASSVENRRVLALTESARTLVPGRKGVNRTSRKMHRLTGSIEMPE